MTWGLTMVTVKISPHKSEGGHRVHPVDRQSRTAWHKRSRYLSFHVIGNIDWRCYFYLRGHR